MYKYWVQITVVTLVELRLNAANHFKMCYVDIVESLPFQGNGQQTDTVYLLREKETYDGQTETNRPNSPPRYRQR